MNQGEARDSLCRCTLIPSALIREELPFLKMAELKVLLVVADQTLGWVDPTTGRSKEQDWLSHSQLKAKTGCASEAVSKATDSLVRRNLIEVLSDTGRILLTPQSRRRIAGRLYFRLSKRVLTRSVSDRAVDKHGDNSILRAADARKTEEPTSPTGIRKAKTTHNNRYINILKSTNKHPEYRSIQTTKQSRRLGGWTRPGVL